MMATMAMIPSTISPVVQVTHQSTAGKQQFKTRLKNVTWAAEDKLCQVRLFAAEDAPSLSGTVLQDLLQAKRSGFMHALIPVSDNDLPPGFEAVSANCTQVDSEAIQAMVAEVIWQCPKKVVYDPTWQVAAGADSVEVSAEQQRVVRMLEAIYPRPSTIPPSPAEPQESYADVKDDLIPQIPLIPFEDEDQGMEEESLPGAKALESVNTVPTNIKSGLILSPNWCLEMTTGDQNSGSSGEWGGLLSGCTMASNMIPKADSELSASNSKNSEANVAAAAAAAAYAVLKAKESGLIDHELLIKILNNPGLMETLKASHTKKKTHHGDLSTNMAVNWEARDGTSCNIVDSLLGRVSNNAAGNLGSQLIPDMQVRQKPFEATNQGLPCASRMQAWDAVGGAGVASQGRPGLVSASQEQSANGMMGIPGQIKETFGVAVTPSTLFPPREDILKELIQRHGTEKNDDGTAQPRNSIPGAFGGGNLGVDVDRYGGFAPGLRGQSWMGNNQTAPSLYPRNDAPLHERVDVDVPRTKSRKPCLYFNTPRGCRNGINCYFMHETAPEKTPKRTKMDISQPQQVKNQKLDIVDT